MCTRVGVQVGMPASRIVCISDTKTMLLANSCLWTGASTLIRNLLVSSDFRIPKKTLETTWRDEYAAGLGKEIYTVPLGDMGQVGACV